MLYPLASEHNSVNVLQAKLALERRKLLQDQAVQYLRNPDAPPPVPKQNG